MADSHYNWSGLYFGGSVGGTSADVDGSDAYVARAHQLTSDGWLGGLQLGYNRQFGRAVIGTEVAGIWSNAEGENGCDTRFQNEVRTCAISENWSVHWLNKVGFTVDGDGRFVAYGIAGASVTGIEIERTFLDTSPNRYFGWSGSGHAVGFTLGAGLQYAISSGLSVGLEYLHTEYSTSTITTKIDFQNTTEFFPPSSHTVEQMQSDTVRFLMNYRFNE